MAKIVKILFSELEEFFLRAIEFNFTSQISVYREQIACITSRRHNVNTIGGVTTYNLANSATKLTVSPNYYCADTILTHSDLKIGLDGMIFINGNGFIDHLEYVMIGDYEDLVLEFIV